MSLSEMWETVTTEGFLNALKFIGTALGSVFGTVGLQKVYGFFFGSGDEVKRILNAICGDRELVTNQLVQVDSTKVGDKTKTIIIEPSKRVKIEGTKIEIDPNATLPLRKWFKRADDAKEVIFHDGVDQTSLYSRGELSAIIKATRTRLAKMEEAERITGRRLIADHIPQPKKG